MDDTTTAPPAGVPQLDIIAAAVGGFGYLAAATFDDFGPDVRP